LAFMDKLNDAQMVSGVVRVIYTTADNAVRFVEIPVGEQKGQEGQ